MEKIIKLIAITLLFTTFSFAQQVPPEVMEIIQKTLNGTEGTFAEDFNVVKTRWGIDSTVKVSDLKPGDPIRQYWILKDSLKNINEQAPINKLVTAIIGQYNVPLLFKGKIVAFIFILNNKTSGWKWQFAGSAGGGQMATEWQKVKDKWPKSKGYNPVLIEVPFLSNQLFFHVPEKDNFNLTFLQLKNNNSGKFIQITDTSYSSLSKSVDIIKKLKTVAQSNQKGAIK